MSGHDDFSTLFELLPVGAYRASAQGRQVRANRAMVRLFGFDDEATMLAQVNAAERDWYVIAGRRAEFRALLEAHGAVREFESEMYRRGSGERIWISENAHLVRAPDGGVLYYEGTVQDITERKRAEEALQVTLSHIDQGIIRLDAAGRVVFYNQRVVTLLDLPHALLAARPTTQELTRLQLERGDFGDAMQMLEPGARDSIQGLLDGSGALQAGRYERRTRDGRMLEVKTVLLPDGGAVRTYSDVTDYHQAQTELAEKTRTLQITLDSMSQGIATINVHGRTVTSNRRHRELLNLPDELMARQPTMEELVRFQIDRGDFGKDFQFVDAVARGYVSVGDKVPAIQGPETYLRKTADGKTLEVRTRPLPEGGVVRTFTDMTDYVRAQEALAQKEAELTALVNNIPDRIWLKDAHGVYRLSNPAHWRAFGMAGPQDIVGKTAHELFGDEAGEHQRATDLQAMAQQEPLFYEDQRASRVTGKVQHVELVKVAMRDEAGRVTGLLGIARDITVRKESEAQLIAAKEAAEAGERAKAEFLANMSHEIRTPMNAVIGMSDLLLDTPLTATQREFAETIRTSGDALLVLINDILDFSKIESGNLALEHVPVNLAECVEGALDLTSGPAIAKGLDLLYWIEDEVPRAIYGDMTRLRQVFINLINNAVKFTQRGEVVVMLARRNAPDGAPLLHGSVRDTGIGIPADRMDRLFQVFSQVDASTTRQYGGTGLGLAICRRLVTLMGGRIWVESTLGEGSIFQFEIPMQVVPSGPAAWVNRKAATLAGRRVLLVDDNATNRHILTLQTARWGMQPRAASSGLQALAWLDAGETFDAAILDVQMPGMDGYMLTAELRKRLSPAQLPVLVLTSLGEDGARFAGLGVTQTLTKPTKAQVLFDAVSALFERPAASTVPAPVAAAPAPAATAPRLAQELPLRVLLAEDNEVNQRVASLILGGLGYDIRVVVNGLQALDAVDAAAQAGEPFDVVLMDVQMPELDGLEATRRLCERQAPALRPWIIAMTANAMEGDRDDCLAAGMDDYLSKPIRAAAISEALKRAGAGLAQRRVGR